MSSNLMNNSWVHPEEATVVDLVAVQVDMEMLHLGITGLVAELLFQIFKAIEHQHGWEVVQVQEVSPTYLQAPQPPL